MRYPFALIALGLAFAAAAAGQSGSYPPTDFSDAGAPLPTDLTVVYRSGVPRAKVMSLANIRNGVSSQVTTVECFGVDDTATIDAGVTAAQTDAAVSGGAVLRLSGNCLYIGDGIVNNPTPGQTRHLVIEGDGVRASSITFGGCSNAECILLGSQSAVGSGHNDGSGIRNLTLVGLAGKPILTIENLEQFVVDGVYFYGGTTQLTVSECRQGRVANSSFRDPSVGGIRIVGEAHSDNSFTNLTLVASPAAPASGSAIAYDKTGTVDAGGVYFNDLKVNGKWSGSGIRFTATTAHSVFIFVTSSAVDGDFADGSLKFVKIINASLTNVFAVNQYPSANSAALILDDVSDVTVDGGTFYSNTGASGADIFLSNSVAKTTLMGCRLTGPTLGVKVDGTTHDADLRLSFINASALTNDATKLVPSSGARYASPPFLLTGTTTSTMWAMLQPGSATAVYARANSGGDLEVVANDAATVLHKIGASGGITANQVTNGGTAFTSTRATDSAPTGNFALFKNAAGAALWQVDITGSLAAGIVPVARVTGLATSATTDTTNASNISSGTLPAGRLPNPSASTLGGVQSKAPAATNFLTGISTSGVPSAAQPAFSDLSGSATDAQVPNDITVNSSAAITTANLLTFGLTATVPSGVPTYSQVEGSTIQVTAPSGLGFQRFVDFQAGSLNSSSSFRFLTQEGAVPANEKLRIAESGHLVTVSAGAPAISCTGTGTSPAAPTVRGTDVGFVATINTGTGSPGSTGTCTVTYAMAYTSKSGPSAPIIPAMVCMPVKGATAWGNGASLQITTESATAPVITWTNLVGGTATALTTSTSYKISCFVMGLEV